MFPKRAEITLDQVATRIRGCLHLQLSFSSAVHVMVSGFKYGTRSPTRLQTSRRVFLIARFLRTILSIASSVRVLCMSLGVVYSACSTGLLFSARSQEISQKRVRAMTMTFHVLRLRIVSRGSIELRGFRGSIDLRFLERLSGVGNQSKSTTLIIRPA